jgi:hypothetical protein
MSKLLFVFVFFTHKVFRGHLEAASANAWCQIWLPLCRPAFPKFFFVKKMRPKDEQRFCDRLSSNKNNIGAPSSQPSQQWQRYYLRQEGRNQMLSESAACWSNVPGIDPKLNLSPVACGSSTPEQTQACFFLILIFRCWEGERTTDYFLFLLVW